MTQRRRYLRPVIPLVAVTLLTTVTLLSACSAGGQAASEGTSGANSAMAEPADLVIYSGRSEELVGPLMAKFTEETGIPIAVRYGETAELAAQLLEEGDGTPAQVYFAQDAGALGAVAAAGLLRPLPAEIAEIVPANYRAADGTWTGVTGRARVIAYDSSQLQAGEVPTSVFELVDPRWRGQVAIAPTNASFQSFVTAMRVTQGDATTRQWLEGLVANDVQRFEKNGLILDAVDAGQVQLGLVNHYYWFEKAQQVGADAMNAQIAFTAPQDPGSLVNVAGVGLTVNSENDAAAATFIGWLLSREAQQWFVDNTFEYPLLPQVAAVDGIPPLASLRGPDVALAELTDLPATQQMLSDVGLL